VRPNHYSICVLQNSMNEALKQQIVHKAQEFWNTGYALEAGKLIFERIPREYRSAWAARVLEITCGHFASSEDIEAFLAFAKNPNQWVKDRDGNWHEVHALVSRFTGFTYHPEPFPQLIFMLAKNVGKVVYNASGYPAPFDHHAGWEIADTLKQIVQGINDAEFETKAWSALCDQKFIELDEFIMCHPACPTCYANGLTRMSQKD
jgi:hypothetical protein